MHQSQFSLAGLLVSLVNILLLLVLFFGLFCLLRLAMHTLILPDRRGRHPLQVR